MDDADAGLAQVPNDPEELVDLRVGQGRGWLVHDHDLGAVRKRLRDLDHLLPRDREVRHLGLRIDHQMQPLEQRSSLAIQLAFIERERQPSPRLAPDEDVLRRSQVRHEAQLLMDDADAELLRRARTGDGDF